MPQSMVLLIRLGSYSSSGFNVVEERNCCSLYCSAFALLRRCAVHFLTNRASAPSFAEDFRLHVHSSLNRREPGTFLTDPHRDVAEVLRACKERLAQTTSALNCANK